jgi:hypothetical protein
MKLRLCLLLALGVCLMSFHSFGVSAEAQGVTLKYSGFSDFDEYWAAARLLLSGGNPYSPEELLRAEQAVGRSGSVPLIMWNPPWTLAFILPVGLADYLTGKFLWLVLHISIVFFSAQLLWRLYGGPSQDYRRAWLVLFTFAPTYLCLSLGQIGPLVLLGLVAFLYFESREAWYAAGAAMTLVAIKPHLLHLFWIAVLFWVYSRRRWAVAAGCAVAVLVAFFIPLIFDARIYSQYLVLYSNTAIPRPFDWATPTLGSVLHQGLDINRMWARLVPSLFGVGWFLLYWRRHQSNWVWAEHLPLIILVSVTTASFAWSFDQIVILPAVIQCAVWLTHSRNIENPKSVAIGYVAFNAFCLIARAYVSNDFWYFWMVPAYLWMYVSFRRKEGQNGLGVLF